MTNEFNIVIAGVGGQGVILMSELLGNAAVADGLNVRGSEVLGMAVRGGSVSSTIRLGDEALAPLAPVGQADGLVGKIAAEAGTAQSANVVMLGALFGQGHLPIRIDTIKKEITARFNERVAPVNIRAFDLGYEEAQKALN